MFFLSFIEGALISKVLAETETEPISFALFGGGNISISPALVVLNLNIP